MLRDERHEAAAAPRAWRAACSARDRANLTGLVLGCIEAENETFKVR